MPEQGGRHPVGVLGYQRENAPFAHPGEHAFLDVGLMIERLFEGGAPVPTVLAIRARKQ